MQKHSNLEDEINRIVASMDEQHSNQEQDIPEPTDQEAQPEETIHIHYFPDAIVILKEEAPEAEQVVDSTSVTPQKISVMPAYAICGFYLFLICSTLMFQLYCIMNPPIATITLIPKSQTVTLNSTLQLGRVLPPLTISQSQTTLTTGKGHQDAKAATGYITLYNGQFTEQTIAAGTILTGSDGIQVVTDQDAHLPPDNPPVNGQATVAAHAINSGSAGNIQALDINTTISSAVFVKNLNAFTSGQDERNYQTVAKADISSVVTPLKTSVMHSMRLALQGQVQPNEQLYILPCSPTFTSDHQPGQEATQVKVTVSQTCSAVAYNSQELATKATAFLASQAQQKTGAGYSLFGDVHVWVKQASVSHTSTPLVFLSFHTSGTWMYGLSQKAQEHIKRLIAGKTRQQAETLLSTLPGVEQVTIRFSGFTDATRLPKGTGYMHLTIFVV